MKRGLWIICAISFGICVAGCGRNKQALEPLEEPVSIEELSRIDEIDVPIPAPAAQQETLPEVITQELGVLPPAPPYSPSVKEIQRALKAAGMYEGAIDGKRGPMTEKGIRDFQKKSGLKLDGVVGPKTWEKLSLYLGKEGSAE